MEMWVHNNRDRIENEHWSIHGGIYQDSLKFQVYNASIRRNTFNSTSIQVIKWFQSIQMILSKKYVRLKIMNKTDL